MATKAYSPKDIEKKQWKCLPWGTKWSEPFGEPPMTETWFVVGPSASGKSSFVMQLAKELCCFGTVLYVSYEEGVSHSFKERIQRYHMDEEQGKFRVVTDDTLEDLTARLAKKRSAKFVIVDSFQYAGWTYEETKALVDRFKHKSFIFVSQEYKGQPMGKPAARLRYMAGMKIRVAGYKAYCQGRYTGDAGSFFTVWEEGVIRTSNNV